MSYDARYEAVFAKYASKLSAPYGVTVETLAAYRRCPVKEITSEDLLDISLDEARRVHHANVWQWQQLHRLPDWLLASTFKAMIEDGPVEAVKGIQRRIGMKETGVIDADMARKVRASQKKFDAPKPRPKKYHLKDDNDG